MRFSLMVALTLSLTVPGVDAYAGEIDTDHLFAFSQGTDIGEVGKKELESEGTGRFGKRGGRYSAYEQEGTFGYIPAKNLHVFASGSLAYFDINNVPDLDDRHQARFGELSLEARYRLMNRARFPFGLALQISPTWSPTDEISGEPVDSYGTSFAGLADKEIVKDLVVSVINIIYTPEATREDGSWERESALNVTGAVLAQVRPGFFIGAGVQHLRQYEGLGLDSLTGQATFVGPNLCLHNKDQSLWVIAGWSTQVAGDASGFSDSRDLVNFERQLATLTVGFSF